MRVISRLKSFEVDFAWVFGVQIAAKVCARFIILRQFEGKCFGFDFTDNFERTSSLSQIVIGVAGCFDDYEVIISIELKFGQINRHDSVLVSFDITDFDLFKSAGRDD